MNHDPSSGNHRAGAIIVTAEGLTPVGVSVVTHGRFKVEARASSADKVEWEVEV